VDNFFLVLDAFSFDDSEDNWVHHRIVMGDITQIGNIKVAMPTQ
tara:strand:+ start:327 stop:458 length:132 start_codon:yes stop_codon:yes gene_type:complete